MRWKNIYTILTIIFWKIIFVHIMDFASKGLSWAENIIQKLEKVCADSNVVQVPCKYVDAVGEHLSTMLDEIASNWLNPTSDSVDEFVSPLEHRVVTEDNNESTVQHDENVLDTMSAYDKVPAASLNEHVSLDTSDAVRDLSQERHKTRSVEVEAIKSSITDGSSENYKNLESISSSVKASKSLDIDQRYSQEITSDSHNKNPVLTEHTETTPSNSTDENQKNLESIALSVEVLGMVMPPGAGQNMNQINTADIHLKSTSTRSARATCSDGTGENYNNIEVITFNVEDPGMDKPFDLSQDSSHGNVDHKPQINSVLTEANVSTSLALSSDICPYESNQNESIGESMPPDFISVSETKDSSICLDTPTFVASLVSEYEQQIEHSKLDTAVRSSEVEMSGGSERRCVFINPDFVPPKINQEIFEEVNLDEPGDDTEFELALISSKACKHTSYKKKLKNVIVSKLFSSKHKRAEEWHREIGTGMQDVHTVDTSSLSRAVVDPEKSPTSGSCESDWVIL